MSNFLTLCRFCTKEDPNGLRNDVKLFVEEIYLVAQFEINLSPGLPEKICDNCTQRLKDAHYFRLLCRESEQMLLCQLNEPMKAPSFNVQLPVKTEKLKEEDLYEILVEPDEPEEYVEAIEYLEEAEQDLDPSHNETDEFFVVPLSSDSKPTQPQGRVVVMTKSKRPRKKRKLGTGDTVAVEDLNSSSNNLKINKSTVDDIETVADIIVDIDNDADSGRGTSKICCQCDYLTYSLKDLHRHYNNAHPNVVNGVQAEGVIQCPLCFQQFDTQKELTDTHLKSKPDLTCPYCHILFQHKMKWRKHLESHDEHQFVCYECDAAFKLYSSFASHTFKHRNEFKFLCTVCGKKFGRKTELKVHMACHQEKMFECDYCGKKVGRRVTMINHMRIHSGEKRYVCEYCNKAYTDLTDKKRHVIAAHTGLYPFICEVCNKGFFRRKFYEDHMNKMHFDYLNRTEIKRE